MPAPPPGPTPGRSAHEQDKQTPVPRAAHTATLIRAEHVHPSRRPAQLGKWNTLPTHLGVGVRTVTVARVFAVAVVHVGVATDTVASDAATARPPPIYPQRAVAAAETPTEAAAGKAAGKTAGKAASPGVSGSPRRSIGRRCRLLLIIATGNRLRPGTSTAS